ncbi:MAG: TetR/AcrR family transcriptional regulator [Planctomycetia bacterium]|nr:TetR/AcrR family transcriptional regulator [Planctomycetia bacterium]
MGKQTNQRIRATSREKLIGAAFSLIFRNGFQATGLDAIMSRAGVTKGAIYHHFRNKNELGYCVFDEVVAQWVRERWIDPFVRTEDPLGELRARMQSLTKLPNRHLAQGCPLNNLIQEVGGVDSGFGARMNALLDDWRSVLAGALRRGQRNGLVRRDLETVNAAAFIVAAIEGVVGIAKPASDNRVFKQSVAGFAGYLETLAPQ